MTKDEALKLALEALEEDELDMVDDGNGNMVFRKEQALTAIKEALAQPEQEPVLWMMPDGKTADKWALQFYRGQKGKPLYTTPPALTQPEQEPLAWISTGPASMIHWTADKPAYGDDWVPLYTTPPQRTWVGLSDEEIAEFDTWHDNREEEVGWCNPSEIVAYIEAKLKEKNT